MAQETRYAGLAVGDVSDATHYVEAGVAAEKAERPSQNHRFDYATKEWIDPRSLQDLKDARWAEVRRERDSAEFGGFTWDGSRFDSDALSQQRITGAVTLAMMNSAYLVDWTLADNTVRSLNAADMIAVGVALGQHVNACHERARLLRGDYLTTPRTCPQSL